MKPFALHPRSYDKSGELQMAEAPLEAHQTDLSAAHFLVHHYEQPDVTAQKTVEITSVDGTSRRIDLADIKSLPPREVTAVLECAGNGRGFLQSRAPGNQFGLGLFHQATWRGVSVADVLAHCHIDDSWTTLVVNAGDEGVVMPEDKHARFGKGLSSEKAMHPDTLLAWQVNDQDLSVDHGAPLRLVVPGWFGIWWVKWVHSIELSDRPFNGFWQNERYTYQTEDGIVIAPVAQQLPRAVIVTPQDNDAIGDDTEITVLAWAGENPVAAVEVTTDDGATWTAATMSAPRVDMFAWSRYRALVPSGLPRGRRRIAARAIDTAGRTQSWQPATNRLGYANNGIHAIDVELLPNPPLIQHTSD